MAEKPAEPGIPRDGSSAVASTGAAGWVMDLGSLLTPAQEQSLEDLLDAYTKGRPEELAVLVVDSLAGQSIEVAPRRVAREWRSGSGDHKNAALLVIARDERAMRWMVGRELQDELSDATCGRIVREVVAPEFERGRYYEGIRAGIEAASRALDGDLSPIVDHPDRRAASGSILGIFLSGAAVAWMLLRASRRRLGNVGALPLIVCTGTGKDVGYRTQAGTGQFRRFGGGGGFEGGGATGQW